MPKTTFKEHFSHILTHKKLFLLLCFVLAWGFGGDGLSLVVGWLGFLFPAFELQNSILIFYLFEFLG